VTRQRVNDAAFMVAGLAWLIFASAAWFAVWTVTATAAAVSVLAFTVGAVSAMTSEDGS